LLTLAGVFARPRGVREWIIAVVGALAMLAVGALTLADAIAAVAAQWNVLFFFLGLMATAAVAEQSGVLAWMTGAAYRLARGRQENLFLLICGLSVLVTATLSNDATILLLTPLVVRMVSALGAPVLPYAFACALLANAASSLLPIANPTNLIVLQAHPLVLSEYLRHLFFPSVAAVLATIVTLCIRSRGDLRADLPERRTTPRPRPPGAIPFTFGLAGVLIAYLVALQVGLPIGPVAVLGGSLLTLALLVSRRLHPKVFAAEIEWAIFPFFAGLVVVVAGASRAGLVDLTAGTIQQLAATEWLGPSLVAIVATLAANAMNNLPAAVLAASGLAQAGSRIADSNAVTAGLLLGIDVGPNFTTVGSLATLLWMMLLRRRGIAMSSLVYLRYSWLPALLGLGAALAVLAVTR
jgi:arsenical pump membrane protein